jgi:hypothetical protein
MAFIFSSLLASITQKAKKKKKKVFYGISLFDVIFHINYSNKHAWL